MARRGNELTMALGAMWSLYNMYNTVQHNRRASENEERLLASMREYEEAAAYMRNPQPSTLLGSGRLADEFDAQQANMFDNNGLFLGGFGGRPIFYNGDRHMLSYGRSGSGKGRDVILGNLAHIANESVIVTDIKDGENAYVTVSHRKRGLGQACLPLNPCNISGIGTCRLNPCQTMIDVAQDPAGYLIDGEDKQFIDKFVPMTKAQEKSENSWAIKGAQEILKARVKYLAYWQPDRCNPGGLWYMVNGSDEHIRAQYAEMIACEDESISRVAASYFDIYEEVPKQYGAYKTAMQSAVEPYGPGSSFADATSASDFDPATMAQGPMTVYAMLSADKIEYGAQWLTLIVSYMIERIAASPGPVRTTVILDELANLPYMPIIPKALKLYREKGIRLWGFCQGRHSLVDAGYSKETIREFEDQSGVLQLWEVEDTQLIQDIEVWSGKTTVAVRGANMGGGGGHSGSFGINEVARPTLQAEDIRAVGHGQQLLKVAGIPHLFHASRHAWFDVPSWRNVLRDPRDISRGLIDWKPERRKRTFALPPAS